MHVNRGQWLTSIRKLGETFHWDPHKVYKWLAFMKEINMLHSESLGFGTLLTVVAYDKYQNDAYTVSNMPSNTVSNTPSNTPSNKVSTRYKNNIRIEEEKEELYSAFAGTPPENAPEDAKNDDDDEGWMTPDELCEHLSTYYARRIAGSTGIGDTSAAEG